MKGIMIMMMCNCEDRPCCDCGQEYLAELRWISSGLDDYANWRDPYDDYVRDYFDEDEYA